MVKGLSPLIPRPAIMKMIAGRFFMFGDTAKQYFHKTKNPDPARSAEPGFLRVKPLSGIPKGRALGPPEAYSWLFR